MKCTWKKRFGRVSANFGISFLTPLMGISIGDAVISGHVLIFTVFYQALFTASIFTAMSVCREVQDWSLKKF